MLFSQALDHILNTEIPLKPAFLFGLSRLEAKEMERLAAVWPSIPDERRSKLVKELVEIAEANFEVNFEPIFHWGLRDSQAEVRAASVDGLWESEDLSLMTQLLQMLQNDPSTLVRAAAATSLGRFVLLGELEKLPPERCRPVFEVLCDIVAEGSEDIEIRRRALESAAYVSDETVIQLLEEAYHHPENKMRVSAIFGMGRSADERWIMTVMGELFSLNPEIRYEAARACGELEARAAVSRLAELIDDPDHQVREVTLWALGQIGGDEARELLQACIEEGDKATRKAAEVALQELEFMYGELDFPFYEFGPE